MSHHEITSDSTAELLDQVSHQLYSGQVKQDSRIKKWTRKYIQGSHDSTPLDILHPERIEKMIEFEAMLHTNETKYISLSH